MSLHSQRGRVAALSRSRTADDPDLIDARRALKSARLEHAIVKTVAEWPPLTTAQLDRLAILLRGESA
ncbi:hypothetical protein GCM10027039_01710 [Terrabacter koreensis]